MNSHAFKQFADYLGFRHRKIIPKHPESNVKVERLTERMTSLYGHLTPKIRVGDKTCKRSCETIVLEHTPQQNSLPVFCSLEDPQTLNYQTRL